MMLVEITRETLPPPSIVAESAEIKAKYEAECQRCGLCCRHPLTKADGKAALNPRLTYYGLQEVKYRWWHGHEEIERTEGYWMRMEDGHCIALKGEIGKEVSCSIYLDRPSTCRQFEAGSEACLRLREKYNGDSESTNS